MAGSDERKDKVYLAVLFANLRTEEESYNGMYVKEPKNKIINGYYSASNDFWGILKGQAEGHLDNVPLCTVMKARFPILPWIKSRYGYFRELERREVQDWQKRDELSKIHKEKNGRKFIQRNILILSSIPLWLDFDRRMWQRYK